MFHMPSRIGRYEIKSLIGAGGMGSLYLARDTNPNTNRLVALKLLLANLDSGDLRERFAREARALASLNHPNIVDIYDSGEFQGSPFIVMEYVRGETIAERIKRRAPMTLSQKIKVMVELCSGLEHAHEAGIIHRDIKPANLMIDRHGRLKILDFGIARVSEGLTRLGVQVTQLNMRIGTPGYMSPEQIEGGEIDPRSDIFAVGAVCYELLTYREAFTGTNTRQIENRVLQTSPEPLASLVPDLDPDLEKIVTRALAKDPNQRYQDASALEEAFDRLLWRLGPSQTPAPAAPRATPEPAPIAPKGAHDSRAEVVYQRCLAIYAEGAHDAARRFAIEALSEDPDHQGARDFMKRFGAPTWMMPQPSVHAGTLSGPTVLRTESHAAATIAADAETVLITPTHPSGSAARSQTGPRFWKPLQIAGISAAVVALVVGGVALTLWMLQSGGPTLTIERPKGGTISGPGINCGTGGSDCSAQLATNAAVYLQAEPDKGFVFGGFTGDCKSSGRTLMAEARSCGATFTKIPDAPATPMVLFTVVPPTGGTLVGDGITCGTKGTDCSVEHPQGRIVKLMALADADFTFKGFTGECAKSGEAILNQPRRCSGFFARDAAGTGGRTERGGGTPPPTNGTTGSPKGGGAGAGAGVGGGAAGRSGNPAEGSGTTTPNPYEKAGRAGNVTDTDAKPNDPKAPPPPPTPEAIAQDAIKDTLEKYRSAYEQRNVEGIQRVYPGAPPGFLGGLRYAFKDMKSAEYTYTGAHEFKELNPSLGTATVKSATLLQPVYKSGASEKPQKHNVIFILKRTDDVWNIVDVKPTLVK